MKDIPGFEGLNKLLIALIFILFVVLGVVSIRLIDERNLTREFADNNTRLEIHNHILKLRLVNERRRK